MKRLVMCVFFFSAFAFGQSTFDGTWKIDLPSSKMPEKPLNYLLQNGTFKCLSCVHNRIDVKADGQDHPTNPDATAASYADHVNVRVVEPNSILITYKVKGKIMSEETDTVSSDGQSMTQKNVDYSVNSSDPTRDEWEFARVSSGPAGSQSISGEWRATKISKASSNEITVTFQSTPNGLKMTDPNGWGFDAKFDGKQYPEIKDPGHTMVSLRRSDDRSFEVTQTRAGKVVGIFKAQVSEDGRAMHTDYSDPSVPGSNEVATWHKQ